MQRWNVIIAALDGHEIVAEEIGRRVRSAWPPPQQLTIESAPLSSLADADLKKIDVVILVADRGVPQSAVLPWLNLFEESGIAVLALLSGDAAEENIFEFAGALTTDIASPSQVLCAMLLGLLHRQKDIRLLRQEVALSQRFHGGLKGEIAKMHEELQLAALVQREFLPREAPSLHGVEFAALWRPTNYVSGDIYDFMRLDEDHVGVFIADAVGHGVPAALMTMVISRSLHTKDIEGSAYRLVPPSEVLARLNMDMIRRQGRTTRFATALYGLINCRQRTMILAGAGHPPPVLLSGNGSSRVLETSGGLLGVFPDETYSQISVDLGMNDRLLFYTDGFEQAFPAASSDTHNRRMPTTTYRMEFDQLASSPTPSDMVDTISRRLDDQSGSLHQVDDLTLICVHAGPMVQPESDGAIGTGDEPVTLRLAS